MPLCMRVSVCVFYIYCDMAAALEIACLVVSDQLVHWLMPEAEVAGGPRAPTQFAAQRGLYTLVIVCMYA